MNRPELIIFDWDGTLFNSVGQIVESLKFAASKYEQPLTDEAAQSIIGLGLPEVMQTLFPQVPHLQQDILVSYGKHYVENSRHDAWFDGVAELLQDLKAQGMKLAVATGKSRRGLDRVLTQTQSHAIFDITRAASETMSKPHPLMLEEILEFTGVNVQNAVMVGDSSYDLEMAMNIKMPRIGVSYGVHDIEILKKYQPLTIVHDITSLHRYLHQMIQIQTEA
ncbi:MULTISPECIES: HAD-IA family hydrolase [unclassified Acinetobacter]|uniref:HAD-IA family hydrolase n=1 Tax=unclassified Acinetobacter TaxID=196816 RepID=UPI00190D9BAE|nr:MULTISPECIES: HAD-IA family hydrolase [unclassified Acinetobacter]MBK0062744.1 HAD-IA family hydrolase [Acinetobacter sp. S55]MBK0065679.1 HAD-IA family hydrolase [Acinetobacter sp. S54]